MFKQRTRYAMHGIAYGGGRAQFGEPPQIPRRNRTDVRDVDQVFVEPEAVENLAAGAFYNDVAGLSGFPLVDRARERFLAAHSLQEFEPRQTTFFRFQSPSLSPQRGSPRFTRSMSVSGG